MTNYNTIRIVFKSGMTAVWEADKGEWDDYMVRDGFFVIKKDNSWVGMYNMENIISIVVK